MEKAPEGKTPAGKLLSIQWPETALGIYANHLVAVSDGTSSYLTFCQVSPPLIVGEEKDKQRQLDQLKTVKAEPVARLIVPLPALREMVRLLQQQINTLDNIQASDASSNT